MTYTVNQLASHAGVRVRTLHYYDRIGLLKPSHYGLNGYRYYDEDRVVMLQQILIFRELGFSLKEIGAIMSELDLDVARALASHRMLLARNMNRLAHLIETVDRTLQRLEGERRMDIAEYYEGFSNAQIEEMREELKQLWGEDTLRDSESRVIKRGKECFRAHQEKGGAIFFAIAELMPQGPASPEVQELIARWREWLQYFSTYSDEAVLGLGRMYRQDPRFAAFFVQIHPDLPQFLSQAVEHCYGTLRR